MLNPDPSSEDVERRLAALEAGIATDSPPAALDAQAVALDPHIGPELARRLRFLIARATVDNRLGLADKAVATLMEARRLAMAQEGVAFRSTISRLLAGVHAWRGHGAAATGELLRAAAEAATAGSSVDFAAALAEAARAGLETGRFDIALVFLDAALASGDLAAAERVRALVNRMQCLNRLGRHQECLREIESTAEACAGWNGRRRLLRLLEQARALAATGAAAAARTALGEARALLPPDPDAFEHLEWEEASIEVGAGDDPAGSIEKLSTLISGLAESHLHLREAYARLALSELLLRLDRNADAFDEAASALRVAVEHSPVIAERARSAILRAGNPHDLGDTARLSQRYMLSEALGRGGFGLVRRAIDMETGAERAIKIVALDAVADAARRARLLADARAEIEVAGRLRHPGVVRVHSAFVSGGSIVIVQDLIVGRPLETLRGASLDAARMLDIFARLAHTLVAMHDEGIVHRDLKPSNVMIDEMDRPVVIDLGLAALAGAMQDGGSGVRGTRGYIAPELLRSADKPAPDPRQDIYAFGRMLDEFLPGPGEPGLLRGLMALRRADALLTLRRAMVAADPLARPASLRFVAAELDRRLAQQPVHSVR